MKSAEEVATKLQLAGTTPVYDLYKKRNDIPRPGNTFIDSVRGV